MQKLKNVATGTEYIITGSIGVPREVEENVFEVWTHFSVDLDGDGQIDTIEVHPESTEWEVIDVPDPEPVVEEPVVETQPVPPPMPQPTQEELERATWLEQFRLLERSLRAKEKLETVGLSFSPEEQSRFDALVQWVADNRKIEYVEYM